MYKFIDTFTEIEAERQAQMREKIETEDAFNELRAEEKRQACANCQTAFQAVPAEIIEDGGFGGATPLEEISGIGLSIRRTQSQDIQPAWGFSIEVEVEGVERPVEYAYFDDETDLIYYSELNTGSKSAAFEELLQRDKELVRLTGELAELLEARFS